MKKEELNKLSKEEIYKLYNQGKLSAEEVESLPRWEQDKLKARRRADKKKEIIELYKEGSLSISDTIAYETNQLLKKNSKNTSTISGLMVFYLVVSIIGVIFYLIGVSNS